MGRQTAKAYLARWEMLRTAGHEGQAVLDAAPEPTTDALLASGQACGVNVARLVALLLDPDDSSAALVAAVVQAEQDAGRGKRAPRGRVIALQDRDFAMLRSLATARMLTAEALEWLHYPTWRRRYRAVLERNGPATRYRPASDLYHRLAALAAAGYVRTITRTSERARWAHQRLPGAYTLTEAGAELLVLRCGVERDTLWAAESRERSLKNLEHAIAIGRCYAALRAAVEYVGGAELVGWRGDYWLDRPNAYDRIAIARRREPVPIQPDATCQLITAALAARYATDVFLLLVIAPTQSRLERIAEVVVDTTRSGDGLLLVRAEDVHPTTVRAHGQTVAAIQWTTQHLPQGIVTAPALTLRPASLWEPGPAQHPPPDPPP